MGEPEKVKADGVEYRPCRACGCPLALVTGPNGKKIPLDLRSPVYTIVKDLMGMATAEPMPDFFVSHFKTCAKAGDFSGAKKR